ncbi:MAG: hypothetical protein HUJ56_06955 [Erysipelotrichaceae bacterium]|nr:hypothetical protein [Erysipelotrichaceae bacterium]
MTYYANGHAGFKKIFFGYLCSLINSLGNSIANLTGLSLISDITSIFALIALVLILWGLFEAKKDIKDITKALWAYLAFYIIQIAISVVQTSAVVNQGVQTINTMPQMIAGFIMNAVVYYFICTAAEEPLTKVNCADTAKLSSLTWKITGILYLILCILTFVSFNVTDLSSILSFVEVIPYAIFTFFLYKCMKGFDLLA